MSLCLHVCQCNIFAFLYLLLSPSTSLHFLLRGARESPHVERSYDKVSRRGVGGKRGEGRGVRVKKEKRGRMLKTEEH